MCNTVKIRCPFFPLSYNNNFRILRVNNTRTICYSLIKKQPENVRKDLSDDIRKLHSTNPNIYLKVMFHGTLMQLIECEYNNILYPFVKNEWTNAVSVNRLLMHSL